MIVKLLYCWPRLLPWLPKHIQERIATKSGLDITGDIMWILTRGKRYIFYYEHRHGFSFLKKEVR